MVPSGEARRGRPAPTPILFSIGLAVCGPVLPWAEGSSNIDAPEILEPLSVRESAPIRAKPAEAAELDGEILEIPKNGETSLTRVLTRATALSARQTGTDDGNVTFMVRGQDPIQTRYYLEGVPLTDAQYNATNLALLPLEMIGRVEVFPEGVPLFLGGDGLGGAVHFRLLDMRAGHAQVGTRVGSFGSLRVFAEQDVSSPTPIKVHADYMQSNEDFYYFDDNGTPFNASDDKWERREDNAARGVTLLPVARLLDTPTQSIRLFSLTAYRESQIPGSIRLPSQAKLTQTYETAGLAYTGDWSPTVADDSSIYLRWDAQNLQNSNPLPSYPPGASRSLSLGARTRWQWRPDQHFRIEQMIGAGWESFVTEPTGSRQLGSHRWELPFGLLGAWAFGRSVVIRPAVMAHYYAYQAESGEGSASDIPVSYFLLSPRLGLQGQLLPQLQWHVTVGSFYRAPTMYEVFGTPNWVTASRDLTYEQAIKADIGAESRFSHPFAGLTETKAYYTYSISRAHNLIGYLPNSQQTQIAVNIGESLIQSHELGLEGNTAPIRVKTGVTLLDTANLSDIPSQYDKRLPLRPEYRFQAELDFEWKAITAGYTFAVVGPVFSDLANTQRLDAISDHGFWVSYSTQHFGIFTLEVRNIADTVTVASLADGIPVTDNTTGYYGYPAAGRRIYLSWKYEI